MGSAHFFIDDASYLHWLATHPNDYIVNTLRAVSPNYMVLHRATCPSISEYTARNRAGAFTERQYGKACGDKREDLRAWVRANGRPDGSFTSEACSRCKSRA